jgi:hypothetical protein
MRSLVRRSGVLSLYLALCFLSSPRPASAQADDPDLKAYNNYQLTLPKYKKYLDAMVNLATAAQKNPAVGQSLEGSGEKSIAQAVASYDKVPQVRSAISAAGFTTRDFVLTQGAFLHAGLAYALMKEGGFSPDSAVKATQVSRANLEFVRKNEGEITRLTKEAEARAPALKEAMGNGEDSAEAEPE